MLKSNQNLNNIFSHASSFSYHSKQFFLATKIIFLSFTKPFWEINLTTMSPGRSSASYGVRTFATALMLRYRASSRVTTRIPDCQHMSGGIGSSMNRALSISSGGSAQRSESKMCISLHLSGSFSVLSY